MTMTPNLTKITTPDGLLETVEGRKIPSPTERQAFLRWLGEQCAQHLEQVKSLDRQIRSANAVHGQTATQFRRMQGERKAWKAHHLAWADFFQDTIDRLAVMPSQPTLF